MIPRALSTVRYRAITTRAVLLAACIALAVSLPGAGSLAQASSFKARADTTVTIKAEGVDRSGKVKSPRQSCITDRKVNVIKQIGTRGGGDDTKLASDTASSDGSWSTGNTGVSGKFYAKVKRTTTCKGDTSPTIRAHR